MKVVTAPEYVGSLSFSIPSLFLAGGITNIKDWQSEVIAALEERFGDKPLIVFNPRRENFPIDDPSAAEAQIRWEYEMLECSDFFTMYFGEGESDQPICMYEYGKHLERRSELGDVSGLVVSAEPGYKRFQDVIIQTRLVNPEIVVGLSLAEHIEKICDMLAPVFNEDIR
jgi:hypothetical protein